MLKDLSSIKKIINDGKYKYIGFLIMSEPDLIINKDEDEQIKTIGTCIVFFKDLENEEVFFIENTKISGCSIDTPYGCFQKAVGTFMSNYIIKNISKDNKEKFIIYDDSYVDNDDYMQRFDNEEQVLIRSGKKY